MAEMTMDGAAGAEAKPKGLLARAAGQMTQGGPMMRGGPATEGGAMPATGDSEPEANVSPEEQALYERFVKNGHRLIYDVNAEGKGTVRKGVMESLGGAGDPKEGLATTAVAITKRVADAAEESGVEVDAAIIQHAGAAILEELGDLQAEAGIADLSEEDLEGALYRAHDLYREVLASEGKLDTAVFAQDFKAMQDADAAGRLDEMMPGATQAAERMSAMQQGGA